jgi:SAM-dependent methyltransferase
MPRRNKFTLYERSVQSPKRHVDWFVGVYKDARGKYARRLREDFCGTAKISCEWVKRNRRNIATGLDLDAEVLSYARRKNLSRLDRGQRGRISLSRENVCTVTSPKSDLIVACNFSFLVFKERRALMEYLRCCLRSLGTKGMVILELAGGPGMISRTRESKMVEGSRGAKFKYVWDQRSFDPITREARYSIHFHFPDGTKMNHAFTYDWRLWTIPEIRDALADAGFSSSAVYWETEHDGRGTGEYARAERGDNAWAYIAYVVGLR